MELLAILFFAWIGCIAWAMVRSDYKHFVEEETPDTDEDDPYDGSNGI